MRNKIWLFSQFFNLYNKTSALHCIAKHLPLAFESVLNNWPLLPGHVRAARKPFKGLLVGSIEQNKSLWMNVFRTFHKFHSTYAALSADYLRLNRLKLLPQISSPCPTYRSPKTHHFLTITHHVSHKKYNVKRTLFAYSDKLPRGFHSGATKRNMESVCL